MSCPAARRDPSSLTPGGAYRVLVLRLSILVLLVHGREALHGVWSRPRRWGITGHGPVLLLPWLLLLGRVSGVLLAVRCWMMLLLLWRRRGRLGVVLRGHGFWRSAQAGKTQNQKSADLRRRNSSNLALLAVIVRFPFICNSNTLFIIVCRKIRPEKEDEVQKIERGVTLGSKAAEGAAAGAKPPRGVVHSGRRCMSSEASDCSRRAIQGQ